MRRFSFPWLALIIGLIDGMVMLRAGAADPMSAPALPLLTLLFMSEFGLVVTGVGAVMGFGAFRRRRDEPLLLAVSAACVLLAIGFFWLGLGLWQRTAAG